MVLKRLFVGNLPDNITGPEVSSKFSHFGAVQNADVKTKNEATFAFVSLMVEDEGKVRQCIDVLNNTKWRGNLIKVQVAKENFLDKLKREQAENRQKVSVISFEDEEEGNEGRGKHMYLPATQSPSVSTTFNLKGSIQSLVTASQSPKSQKQEISKIGANGLKRSKTEETSSDDSDEESVVYRPPPFRGLGMYALSEGTNEQSTPNTIGSVQNTNINLKGAQVTLESNQKPSTAVKEGITVDDAKKTSPSSGVDKLQEKLLAIAGVGARGSNKRDNQHQRTSRLSSQNETRQFQPKQVAFSDQGAKHIVDSTSDQKSTNTSGTPLNFKKRNSDLIRQKSFEARQNLNSSRSAIIKSSLLSINIQPPVNEKSDSTATPKISSNPLSSDLFDDNQEDNEELKSQFKIKPQYEGEGGQTNLELSSKFSSYDSRFVIDKRFRDGADKPAGDEDDENDEKVNLEKENLANFSILSDVLGTHVTSDPKPVKPSSQSKANTSCIIQRYDPDATIDEGSSNQKKSGKRRKIDESESQSTNNLMQVERKEDAKDLEKEEPKVASYHVASNLKDLFSTDSAKPTFSLLQTYRPESDTKEETDDRSSHNRPKKSLHNNSSKGNESFWQPKNPFKYDSSDSEEEEENTTGANDVVKSSGRAEKFFFIRNDKRFEGLEEYFLKNDENLDDVLYRFNNGERQELRLICRGKIKNTKRKSDKRIESLRRYKRKLKAQRREKYAPQGSNAVPVGGKSN